MASRYKSAIQLLEEDAFEPLTFINPVFAPTQPSLINLIDLYWMSRYKDTDYDDRNQKKVFFNIIFAPVMVAAKMIDLDPKDIRIMPEPGQSLLLSLFMERDLNNYMKTHYFAQLLNSIAVALPKYGSVVLKRTYLDDGSPLITRCPLSHIRIDPTANSIPDSVYFGEWHRYTPNQLRKQPWDKKAIEYAIRKNGEQPIVVWEFYGDVAGSNDNYFIIADVSDGVPLYSDKRDIKDWYKEGHWDKVDGRWLGRGQVELLFEDQIHLNWISYLKARGLEWTSKHVWQSSDYGIDRNILTDIDDGDVLKSPSGIQPVAMEERNLQAYSYEESRWEENIQRKTFASDILRGKRPPAGTPLGSAVLATQLAGGFFNFMQEEYVHFLKEVLWDWIIPEFKNQNSHEHLIDMIGADDRQVKLFDELMTNLRTNDKVVSFLAKNGEYPTPDQISVFRSFEKNQLQQPGKRYGTVPASAYERLQHKIEVVITGESSDVQGKITAIQTALQNTQDPHRQQELINRLLVMLGEEPLFIDVGQNTLTDTFAQSRGSAPRNPAQRNTPTPGVTSQVA